ncbi:hypothetical protein EXS73_00515 [Candidatus Pacearchaeota archaeon]|nr:hypothetical protein [Candidatus Pacearchaeota archaeon]
MDNNRLRTLVHQLEQNQAQLQAITQQLIELESFTHALPEAIPGSTILAPLGKGVFLEAQLAPALSCFVEVGAGIVLKKTIGEVTKTLNEQTSQLRIAKTQLLHYQADVEQQAQKLLEHNL